MPGRILINTSLGDTQLIKFLHFSRYLADNNKLGSGAHKDSKESGGSSGIWDDILSKRSEPTSKSEIEKSKQVKSNQQKMDEKSKEAKPIENDDDKDSDDKLSRGDLIAKYDELAASCTKRIINLDSMISKVREEKQRLLENTLSSASSLITGQKENVTEYMDYPQPDQNQPMQPMNISSPLSDSKGTNAPSSDFSSTSGTAETSMPLENRSGFFAAKNKLLGESKDSGVGISRPVTSSDYRDSPDLKQNTKSAEPESGSKLLQNALREFKRDAKFEAVLKDIPKKNYRIPSTIQGQQPPSTVEQEHSPEQVPTSGRDKPVRPPVAMAR